MKEEKDTNLFDLLILFFRWIGRGFRNMFRGIGWCLQLNFQYIILTLVVLSLGVWAGFHLSQHPKRYYRVEGMAVLNGPTAHMVQETCRPLSWALPHQVPGGQNFVDLCQMSPEVATSIKRLETFFVIDNLNDSTPDIVDFKHKHNLTDTLNVRMNNHLYFRFRTKRIDKLNEIEQGLLHYFNTHPTLVKWNQLHRDNLHASLQTYNKQILYLDSLSKRAYLEDPVHAKLTLHNNSLIIGEQKKQFFYEQIAGLLYNKEAIELALMCDTVPVYFPAHLTAFPRAINSRLKMLAICLILSYILAVALAAGWRYRKSICAYLRRS